jgi:hypothetical protein
VVTALYYQGLTKEAKAPKEKDVKAPPPAAAGATAGLASGGGAGGGGAGSGGARLPTSSAARA